MEVEMVTNKVASVPVRALALAWVKLARQVHMATFTDNGRLKVFLDCDEWFEDLVRPELDFVIYVDSREEADVCVRVTPERKAGYYEVTFVGAGTFELIEASARLAAA